MNSLISKLNNLLITNDEKILLKDLADEAYFNGDGKGNYLLDSIYDKLVEELKSKNLIQETVGKLPLNNKKILPLWMGSLDKIHSDKEIKQWLDKKSALQIQCKLDGVSCLIVKKEKTFKAFTRGNGREGSDISHLLPFLFPRGLQSDDIVFRGEIMIPKEVFEKKYKLEFANSRSFVSGIVNRKKENLIESEVSDLRLVAYELIHSRGGTEDEWGFGEMRITEQISNLQACRIETVDFVQTTSNVVNEQYLTTLLKTFREKSIFDMDGLVVVSDERYKREDGKNPKHAVAFKIKTVSEKSFKEAEVVSINWRIGKTGIYTPRIQIVPTEIDGVTISYLTGFNARYLLEKEIGEGAIIFITRAGDTIPQVTGVKKSGVLKFPEKYEWKGCQIVNSGDSKEYSVKKILHFIKNVKIPNVKEGTISKLYDHGFTTVDLILELTQSDLLLVDGIGSRSSEKIFSSIQKGFDAPIENFLAGYNAFGDNIGLKKIQLILEQYPTLFDKENLDTDFSIKGIGPKTEIQIKQNFYKAKQIFQKIQKLKK